MVARAQKQVGPERVPWSPEEDKILAEYMRRYGDDTNISWKDVSRGTRLNRNGKSCRLRWINYLRPGIKKEEPFTEKEEATIIQLQKQHGNKWATIARQLPGRTEVGVKNFWNTHLKKKKKKIPKKETRPGIINASSHGPNLHQLLATAESLTCAVNDLRDQILTKLHHGHGCFHATTIINSTADPAPATVFASVLEPSNKAIQAVLEAEMVKITPAHDDQEIAHPNSTCNFDFWEELLIDNEISDFFCRDASLHF